MVIKKHHRSSTNDTNSIDQAPYKQIPPKWGGNNFTGHGSQSINGNRGTNVGTLNGRGKPSREGRQVRFMPPAVGG